MSTSEEKKRFSARVKTGTLDKIEAYQDDNNLDNRSNAIEVLVDEELGHDPDRPDGLLASLLYEAEQIKHTALLAAAVFVALASFVTAPVLPAVVDGALLFVALLYALAAFFGFAAPAARRLRPDSQTPADADEEKA